MAVVGIWVGASTSGWATITFDLDSVITGDSPASVRTPWLTAGFTTVSPNNRVSLVLSANNLTGNEDVKEWLFNIDPKVTQAQLNTIYIVSKRLIEGAFKVDQISLIKEQVDGVTRAGFSFDFDLGLPNGKPAQRFTGGDKVEIYLGTTLPKSTLSLTEDIFNYSDDTGTYYSAAHIRNTAGPEGSGWIGTTPVPEPSTIIAGALLLLPFGASAIRILRKNRVR